MKKLAIILVCAAAGLGLYFLLATPRQPAVLDATFFGEIKRVTLQFDLYDGSPPKSVEVTSAALIAEMFKDFQVVPKRECDCDHMESVIIHAAEGNFEASICDHCFDLLEPGWYYTMHPGFYNAFHKEAVQSSRVRLDAPRIMCCLDTETRLDAFCHATTASVVRLDAPYSGMRNQ